jgi:hypothetical protein
MPHTQGQFFDQGHARILFGRLATIITHFQTNVAIRRNKCHFPLMSMAELMRVVAGLPAQQQKELAAFLLHLRLQHDTAWQTEMARRIDNEDPSKWVTLEDWKTGLTADGKP